MNTPAHAIINLAMLARGRNRDFGGWILAGAVVPDAPMFAFYLWQKLVVGSPEARIWGELYFDPNWQLFFDAFNSVPLAALGGFLAWRLSRPAWLALFASAVLHCAFDLPLHREDAHRHFLPLSDWKFVSPVSYWDPAHFGAAAAFCEWAAVVGGCVLLWRRYPRALARCGCALVCAVYSVGYLGFYVIGPGLTPP